MAWHRAPSKLHHPVPADKQAVKIRQLRPSEKRFKNSRFARTGTTSLRMWLHYVGLTRTTRVPRSLLRNFSFSFCLSRPHPRFIRLPFFLSPLGYRCGSNGAQYCSSVAIFNLQATCAFFPRSWSRAHNKHWLPRWNTSWYFLLRFLHECFFFAK